MLKSLEDLLKKLGLNGVDTFSRDSREHRAAKSLEDFGLVVIKPHLTMPDVFAAYLVEPRHDTRRQLEKTFPRD